MAQGLGEALRSRLAATGPGETRGARQGIADTQAGRV